MLDVKSSETLHYPIQNTTKPLAALSKGKGPFIGIPCTFYISPREKKESLGFPDYPTSNKSYSSELLGL